MVQRRTEFPNRETRATACRPCVAGQYGPVRRRRLSHRVVSVLFCVVFYCTINATRCSACICFNRGRQLLLQLQNTGNTLKGYQPEERLVHLPHQLLFIYLPLVCLPAVVAFAFQIIILHPLICTLAHYYDYSHTSSVFHKKKMLRVLHLKTDSFATTE